MNPLLTIKTRYENTIASFRLTRVLFDAAPDKVPPGNPYFGLTREEVKKETDAVSQYIDNLFVLGLVASFESFAKDKYVTTVEERLDIEGELDPFKKGAYGRLKEFADKRIRIEEMLNDYGPLVDEAIAERIRGIIEHRHKVAHGVLPIIDGNNEPTAVFETLTEFLEQTGLAENDL